MATAGENRDVSCCSTCSWAGICAGLKWLGSVLLDEYRNELGNGEEDCEMVGDDVEEDVEEHLDVCRLRLRDGRDGEPFGSLGRPERC